MKKKIYKQATKEEIILRLKSLNITQRYLAKKHQRFPQQITQALNGEQPKLLHKIILHLERLEARQ